jgi:hypothetical protein
MSEMNESFVYFCGDNQAVRIGYSDNIVRRLAEHTKYGLEPLAIIPATEVSEGLLHNFFLPHLIPGRDKSTYRREIIFPYVERLLHWGYAAPSVEEAMQWSQSDFQLWRPEKMVPPMWEGNQGTLFVTEGMKADARDTYETPDEIVEVCRRALGGNIDTDPCSKAEANRRIQAKSFYTEKQNGLTKPWFGRVFLNPPYSNRFVRKKGDGGNGNIMGKLPIPAAALFIEKLVNEINLGNVTEAITVLNLQSMPTLWFPPLVWKNASAHGIWKKRIDFIRPLTKTGSKPFSSSKNGTIFSYFGLHPERFLKEFLHHAMVWK